MGEWVIGTTIGDFKGAIIGIRSPRSLLRTGEWLFSKKPKPLWSLRQKEAGDPPCDNVRGRLRNFGFRDFLWFRV